MAEVGKERLSIHPRPKVGILATGDELVPVGEQPGPGQIRNSNEAMLGAQTQRAGGHAVLLGIARDNHAELRERIAAGLRCDVLLLSGGVSEGTHDLVPAELAALGVRNLFHKVNMRPGKPLWFGVWKGEPAAGRLLADLRLRVAGESGQQPGLFRGVCPPVPAPTAGIRAGRSGTRPGPTAPRTRCPG